MVNIDKKDFSKWFNEVLELAEIVDIRYPVKGMPVYMPYGFALLKKLFDKLEKLLNDNKHHQVLFPLLIGDEEFKKEEQHIHGFSQEVFITADNERKLIIRPTSETAMYPILKLWVKSHSQLPFKIHQTCCVYRNETKSTRPLIRGREVYWNEAHTVHETFEDAKLHHKIAVDIYKRFFDSLLISYIVLVRPDHDKFPGAVYTVAFDAVMPDGKILQIGTVHHLGQNFSKAYDFKILTSDNRMDYPHQLCYGISMRALAALISIHGDEKGLIIPTEFSDTLFVIIPILKNETKELVMNYCEKVRKLLEVYGKVEIDLREKSSGEKHYYWELKGVPFRVEIGKNEVESNKLVVKDRLNHKYSILLDEINYELIAKMKETLDQKIKSNAVKNFSSMIKSAKKVEDFEDLSGLAKAGWCENEKCEQFIREKYHVEVRGYDFNYFENKKLANCIVCNSKGYEYYWGKPY
ncbi:MAG: proline--tRNA ligase [Candidatus Micrarchaeota archaeon]|nr:proline--tRNA ligase [Candidatus Micrarchaeota archaeon]